MLYAITLLAAYFCLFASSAIPNHALAEYSQNQNYSFRAEINTIDHIPAQRVG
jgi:hypothetical protein